MKLFKFAALVAVLVAVNPRLGVYNNSQIYAISCNAGVAASIGANGIGSTHFDPNNRFSALAMSAFGC